MLNRKKESFLDVQGIWREISKIYYSLQKI